MFAWLRWVDATFSTYRADSEICRLERGELALADAHPLVREVLGQCERLRERTGGFFDLRATGRLDPSGLVKGWAVDRAAALLDRAGCTRFCIDAGGDLRLRGGPWRVGIRHPHRRRRLAGVIAVTDAAVATSGTYERGRHIVDPHTGRPATDALSVTIVGPDLATADAYATAAFAMGEAGPALDRRPRRLRRDDDPARRSRALHARIRRAAELDDRFRCPRARMVAYRGCRASPARSAQWQSHGPIQRVPILRRGTRPGGCVGRGIDHLTARRMLGAMSTTTTAIVLALVGVLAVAGVSFAFFLVGRAEDRDRAAEEEARKPRPEPEPEDHSHENGRIARDRRRPMPPRRP